MAISIEVRLLSLSGSYFSLIDVDYYSALITLEPWDGWLHPFFREKEITQRYDFIF